MRGIAEVNSSDQIVRFASLSQTTFQSLVQQGYLNGEELSYNGSGSVTNATGAWTLPSFTQGDVLQGNASIGRVNLRLTFWIPTVNETTDSLEFDINVSGWPWASSSDYLGLAIDSNAPPGVQYSWDSGDDNLTESFDSGHASTVSIGFNDRANASSGTSIIGMTALTQSNSAMVLLNFTGVPGGYANLHYDPWVEFGARTGSTTVPTPVGNVSLESLVLILGVGTSVVVLLGANLLRSRRKLDREFRMATRY